jgi:type II secretory pathway component PulF
MEPAADKPSEPLSGEEAEILVAQLAHTSGAGVPLATGLKAAAQEVDSRRLSRVLNRLADSIASGASLAQALEKHGGGLPTHIVSLLTAAEKTGRIGSVFSQWVACRQATHQQWRNLRSALAYPLVTVILAAIVFLFLLFGPVQGIRPVIDGSERLMIYDDLGFFSGGDTPDRTPVAMRVLVWWSDVGIWYVLSFSIALALAAVAVRLFGGRAGVSRVVTSLPVIGKLWQWSGTAEMLRLLALLIDEHLPLGQALKLLGPGLSDAYVGRICGRLTAKVEQGTPLWQAIDDSRQLPRTIVPLVRWGEQTGQLPAALRTAAEMLEGRLARGGQLLATLLPPLIFVAVAAIILSMFAGIMIPLLETIRMLDSWNYEPSPLAPRSSGPVNLIWLVLPGLALFLALWLLGSRQRMWQAGDPLRMMMSLAGWTLVLGGAFGALVGIMGIFSIGMGLVAVVVLLMCASALRQHEHRSLLWSLALSAGRGIPLPDTADAFADETQGDSGLRAAALAENLRLGMPLDQAARRARLRMSTSTRLAIRLGNSLGLFGPALKQQMLDRQNSEQVLTAMLGRVYYLAVIACFGCFILIFVMLKIVPVFNKMFDDFGLKLPPMTQQVVDLSRWFVDSGLAIGAVLLCIPLAALLIAGALYYVGALTRNLPLVAWLCRRFDSAVILRSLALVVERGYPIPRALRILAEHYPLSRVGRRLHFAVNDIESGAPWLATLRKYRFLHAAEVAVLQAAERAGNLPWALEELADSALRRQVYYLQAWYNIVFPIALLGFGFLVSFFVISMFMPLISLISGLS